jgi:hypothetical protein
VDDAPEREWHPFRYFAVCPRCGAEAEQDPREAGLFKAWAHATGPRSPEGKAIAAKNLAGHPTPEEALRTRFNAMKHGLAARTATYFPAKPGGYPHCESCDVDWGYCIQQPACLRRTELFMRHHIAFETRDPGLLMELRADLQANVQAIIDDIILAIIADGVRLKTPAWYYDKEGCFHLAEYTDSEGERRMIHEINAHPLLKILGELVAKNNLTLGDMGMTPKVQDEQDTLRGHLEDQGQARAGLLEFQRRQAEATEALRDLVSRSYRRELPVTVDQDGEDG